MSFNIEQHLKEMQDNLTKLKELNQLNMKDLKEMIEEEKKREEMKDLRYWKHQYKKLSKEKITNNLKLIDIQSRSQNCDDKIDYVQDIILEHAKKENDKIHLKYLRDYLDI